VHFNDVTAGAVDRADRTAAVFTALMRVSAVNDLFWNKYEK
jgi:hypothetical protein